MDMNILAERYPRKRVDLSAILAEGDYITIRPVPLKRRYDLIKARGRGVDTEKIMAVEAAGRKIQATDMPGMINDDFDGGAEYQILLVALSVDPDNHSLTANGGPVKITAEMTESWADNIPALFNAIYAAAESYYQECSAGEANAGK